RRNARAACLHPRIWRAARQRRGSFLRERLLGGGELLERLVGSGIEALLVPGRGVLLLAEAAQELADLVRILRRDLPVEAAALDRRLIGLERLLLEVALRNEQGARLGDGVVDDVVLPLQLVQLREPAL